MGTALSFKDFDDRKKPLRPDVRDAMERRAPVEPETSPEGNKSKSKTKSAPVEPETSPEGGTNG
ncbi:hypothetical protein LEP1GSC165_0033 [Leptospira santarosai str. CBC523]|uniref:hypothetical protein n=1 Tax=Leptospira santarosai TaxID=28183 RepID=UPI0002BD83FC|nr:hypothetical protein [Leptospira santarosai]EMO12465.1 hypothetical protein LEP1GSC165_0033 [Leptospira santarosai str. CBC523]